MPTYSDQTPQKSTILVTGGSRGIGRALCRHFGQKGWHVGVHYHERKTEAEQVVTFIRQDGGQSIVLQADIRQADQVDTMVEQMVAVYGHLDAMVCNAGIAIGNLLLRLADEEWDKILTTNLTGTFHCLQAAGRQMLKRGGGSIIVVSSYAGLHGDTGQSAYAASKAGLLGLVKSAALEWGSNNIRVNAILPGRHRTEIVDETISDADLKDHILGRTPDIDDVVRSVYRLAVAPDISGQIWNLDSRIV
jgi:3-oxoacyl-[acyl-carrier protein] reductase